MAHTPDKLIFNIVASEPEMAKLQAASDPAKPDTIWQDDVVEISLAHPALPSKIAHFVVSPGGNRWMELNGRPTPEKLDQWSAQITRRDNAWEAKATIPRAIIGEISPEYAMSIARNRKISQELSAWTWLKKGFNSYEFYGLLAIGDLEKRRNAELQRLRGDIKKIAVSAASRSAAAEADAIAKLPAADVANIYNRLENLSEQLKMLKLGKRTFLVSLLGNNYTPVIPFIPDEVATPQDKISVRCAVNEICAMPIAITNLTPTNEEYRVLLHCEDVNDSELTGLRAADGKQISADKITLYRAIRAKDSELAQREQRFDALAECDVTQTVYAPSRDSALLWLNIDTAGVKPGKYRGFLRVIPLNWPGKWFIRGGWKYEGGMSDMPFELEVLPIELSRNNVIPFSVFSHGATEDLFRNMAARGVTTFMFSPWFFDFRYDDAGNVTERDTAKVIRFRELLKRHIEWGKKYGIAGQQRFMIGYSAYRVFNKSLNNNRFKEYTPAWRNAWSNYLKNINAIMNECGVASERYEIEIWDEPHSTPADDKLVLETLKVAKAALPQLHTVVTLGASMQSVPTLRLWLPYVEEYTFWGSYFDTPAYRDFAAKMHKLNKRYSFYFCSTSGRNDLYGYYRMHPWIGKANNVDGVSFYCWMQGPGGFHGRGAWKTVHEGALAYRAGDNFVSSIRLETMRKGFEDLKYLHKLQQLAADPAVAKAHPDLVSQAKKLLISGPERVAVSHAHDKNMADKVRNEAIDLILKLQVK